MDALEYLAQQHREMMELFGRMARAQGPDRRDVFDRLDRLFTLHSRLEEQRFYPAARSARTRDLVDRSAAEHAELERMMSEARRLDASSPAFDAAYRSLKEALMAHVRQEEDVLFPKARTWLGARRLRELGDELRDAAEAGESDETGAHRPGAEQPTHY